MKSQRLTLLISPEEKKHFKDLAENRGLSTSELVREAVRAYDVNSIDDLSKLAALTAEMRAALPSMRRSLRQANASVERSLASIAMRRAKR
jgi:predicted DNA-binding protein